MTGRMDVTTDIRSLTDFKRHTSELTEQLKATGRPLVLTVNGKAAFVVQDAASYQAVMDAAEASVVVEGIGRGLLQMKQGEGQSTDEFFEAFRIRHGIRPEDDAEPQD